MGAGRGGGGDLGLGPGACASSTNHQQEILTSLHPGSTRANTDSSAGKFGTV